MIAFFDTSALIYLIEGAQPFAGRVRSALLQLHQQHPVLGAAVCRLTRLECRVLPLKRNDAAVLASYDGFFARSDLLWIELSPAVVELATAIRVETGLKTPDALQAASCLQLGTEHAFLTGDSAFQRVSRLNVTLLA